MVRKGREGKGEWETAGRGWEKGEGKGVGKDLAPPKKILVPPLVIIWYTEVQLQSTGIVRRCL